jgi:putative ABC transport system permease protein
MLKNYIKIALRNLWKNKIDSAISIIGLAVGLACCILLAFYVRFEWSQDDFHKEADKIYRIAEIGTQPNSGEKFYSLSTPTPLATALDSTFPEIESVLNITKEGVFVEKDGQFNLEDVMFADPGFFSTFTFPIISGDSNQPLSNPSNIVLTEKSAMYHFGEKDVVGESLTIRLDEEIYTFTVSAVAKNLPSNSSMQFEMVLPFENIFLNSSPDSRKVMKESWHIGFGETWLTLNEQTKPAEFENKLPPFIKTNYGRIVEIQKKNFSLQPLSEAYFDQRFQSGITGSTNILYSQILAGIALIILAIAGMNFMSLTLSRAQQRGQEMGIRKASGAQSGQISFQIFGEVLITSSFAFLLGLVFAELTTPLFQQITGKVFEVHLLSDPILWIALLAMVLIVTLITGFYPALRMSREKATLLFSSNRSTKRTPLVVKGLICTQFALAIAFLIGTFAMSSQLNFLLHKDLGYNSSNVISVALTMEGEDLERTAKLFSEEAQRLSDVQKVSVISGRYITDPKYLGKGYGIGMGTAKTATTLEGFNGGLTVEVIDENYVDVLDLTLLEGRNFNLNRPSELKEGIIINEKFAQTMAWENPVGKTIVDKPEGGWQAPLDGKKVIGLISNYHFRPLHQSIEPIVLQHAEASSFKAPGTILIKTTSGELSSSIEKLSEIWSQIVPKETFRFNFLDEMVALQYQQERRWQSIIQFSSIIAIALACFGLFGLASLSAQKRVKEIGIRKVLGASIANIITLLSKDFMKLVIIGFLVAIPIAWYAMNLWLADFAYRIEMGASIFTWAGITAFAIAMLTVSWQSIKAALANPVDSLKSE